MKVTMEIDCTPAEARLFFGLPNVEPMQDAVMAQLEKRMLTEMDRFSPEGIMKSWLSLFPQNAERLPGDVRCHVHGRIRTTKELANQRRADRRGGQLGRVCATPPSQELAQRAFKVAAACRR